MGDFSESINNDKFFVVMTLELRIQEAVWVIPRIPSELNESQGALTRVKNPVLTMSAKKFITDSVLGDFIGM